MWCVPTAIAYLTGWSREKVWLDILAQRHERGRRLTNVPGRIDEPHGGAHAAEGLRTLRRAGYVATDMWRGTRRMSTAEFQQFVRETDDYFREPGYWLVLQTMHLACCGPTIVSTVLPGLPIAKAWRVEPNPTAATDDGWEDYILVAGVDYGDTLVEPLFADAGDQGEIEVTFDAPTLREAVVLAETEARRAGECVLVCAVWWSGRFGFDTMFAAVYAKLREAGNAAPYEPLCSVSPTGRVEFYPVLNGFAWEGG